MRGRPTKYNAEMPNKVFEYLEQCDVKERIFHKTVGERSDTYEQGWNVKIPTIEGLSFFLGVNVSTIYEWEQRDDAKDFSDALEILRAKQKEILIESSLSGKANAPIAKLLLSAMHGIREGQDITSNGKQLHFGSMHSELE